MNEQPMLGGTLLALGAAIAFGLTAPFIARTSGSPFAVASLLYLGAASAALVLGGRLRMRGVDRLDLRVLVPMVIAGAVIAPSCLVFGLAHTGATTGSLLLNLEAFFTVVLASRVYREPIGRRVVLALAVMTLGGVLLGVDAATGGLHVQLLGVLAIVIATFAWGIDNTLSRKLAERDPLDVVCSKGALGAALSASIALVTRSAWPTLADTALLLVCGATGYGLSLRLYLLAQRRIGAARTGSVFAAAPFVGAGVAWVFGDRGAGWLTLASAACFAAGVYLHATEPQVADA